MKVVAIFVFALPFFAGAGLGYFLGRADSPRKVENVELIFRANHTSQELKIPLTEPQFFWFKLPEGKSLEVTGIELRRIK